MSLVAFGVEQLPLVEDDQHRAAGGVDALGEALVLVGDALGGVDDEQGDVGLVDRGQGPHDREVLGAVVDLAAAAHAGGVDEADRPVVGVHDRVDRVARGAGHVVHHGAVVADEAVEQRGLADVGPADDRDGEDPVGFGVAGALAQRVLRRRLGLGRRAARLDELLDDPVEQVAGAAAVQGADTRTARRGRGS